jgi:hypothetical protein
VRCRWKSVWQSGAYQSARLKTFDSAVNDQPVDSPKERRRGHGLIDQISHRCTNRRIAPDRFEEFLDPMSIDLNIVIKQEQIVVPGTFDRKISLPSTVPFRVVEVSDVQSCFGPALVVCRLDCLCVSAAVDDDHFRDWNCLFRQTL